jgi:uncharacterized protein (TIGR00369 family)
MTEPSDQQTRLLELFEGLPPALQSTALQAVEHLAGREPHTGPFGWLMGYRCIETGAGRARYILDVDAMHLNSSGVAHGGVLCTLADAVMGSAAYSTLEPEQRCVTAELKVNFLKPIPPGRITADARVMHKGSRRGSTRHLRDHRPRSAATGRVEYETPPPAGGGERHPAVFVELDDPSSRWLRVRGTTCLATDEVQSPLSVSGRGRG